MGLPAEPLGEAGPSRDEPVSVTVVPGVRSDRIDRILPPVPPAFQNRVRRLRRAVPAPRSAGPAAQARVPQPAAGSALQTAGSHVRCTRPPHGDLKRAVPAAVGTRRR